MDAQNKWMFFGSQYGGGTTVHCVLVPGSMYKVFFVRMYTYLNIDRMSCVLKIHLNMFQLFLHTSYLTHILFFTLLLLVSFLMLERLSNGFLVMNKTSIFELFCVLDVLSKCGLNIEINKNSTYFIPKVYMGTIKTVYVDYLQYIYRV